jgi:TolB-like protein/Tfp pilus assembly protein PilF
MHENPNKLSRFWQELKRRKVVHVITVYASATFVIIELINNLAEPLNLPPNLLTIVVIVLAVGFPLAIILSWLYDLTSEGVEKTKPNEELEEGVKTVVPNAWKIATYVSFVVIVGLAVFNIVGGTKQLRAGDIQSLVVLPFENFTGDEQLENMISSMHSLLCGDMGRIGGLRVIGKTSSRKYKDVDLSAPEIAKELNVDAVVETTVMCLGDTVCMQFRLISTTGEEDQLWIADYKEDKSQILNLYNRITRQISEEVMIELTPGEERLLAKSRTVDREAYDEYLMGLSFLEDFSKESLYKAMENLNSAIEKDPEWAPLYAGLAKAWIVIAQTGYVSASVAYQNVYEYLNKALELDPNISEAHFISGMSAYLSEWNWDKGEKELLKALAINPNDVLSRIYYAQLLVILQRPEEASAQGRLAIELDPLNSLLQVLYSALLVGIDDCETALAHLEEVVAVAPEDPMANNVIELAAFRCGNYNRAFEAAKYILGVYIDADALKNIERIYEEQGFTAAYGEITHQMEAFAENYPIAPIELAVRYIYANMPEKAMDWLEKGFKQRDPNMSYIATGIYNLDPLFSNPRFIAIVNKMNLPIPTTN